MVPTSLSELHTRMYMRLAPLVATGPRPAAGVCRPVEDPLISQPDKRLSNGLPTFISRFSRAFLRFGDREFVRVESQCLKCPYPASWYKAASGMRSSLERCWTLQGRSRAFTLRGYLLAVVLMVLALCGSANASADETKRLLLIYQGPDGHPATTHEYQAGLRVLRSCLENTPNLEIQTVAGDGDWTQGPQLLAEADGAVLFVAQGARWIFDHPRLQEAFASLAQQGGGLVALHWAIGTKTAEPIDGFVNLFGGCHGGPDRKYAVVETIFTPAAVNHPVLSGVESVTVQDEFYYRLKHPVLDASSDEPDRLTYAPAKDEALVEIGIQPLIKVDIKGQPQTVAWAWERPDGGRSFGFSGLHFHKNWQLEPYRRLVTQATLWTLGLPIAERGVDVSVSQDVLSLSE